MSSFKTDSEFGDVYRVEGDEDVEIIKGINHEIDREEEMEKDYRAVRVGVIAVECIESQSSCRGSEKKGEAEDDEEIVQDSLSKSEIIEMNMTGMIASQGALKPSERCLFFNKGQNYGYEHEDFYFNDLSTDDLRSDRVIVAVTKKYLFLFKENPDID